MKKLFSFLLVLLVTISVTGITTSKNGTHVNRVVAMEDKEEEKEKFVKDELVICYNNGVNLEEASKKIKEKHGVTQLEVGYNANFEVVKIPNDKKLEDLISEISKEKDVRYVENNYYAYLASVPNDPYFDHYQWNFYDYGQESTTIQGYPSNFGVQAVSAWDLFAPTIPSAVGPGEGIKVAILDTGIAYENYKIYQKIKGKQVLVKEYNQAPDLATTSFDSTNARDFSTGVTGGIPHANDTHGHGTHVCGTIAQSTNNKDSNGNYIGCAGIAYKATILPVKVIGTYSNGSTYGTSAGVANGIRWATDKGARVISMSIGVSDATTLSDAVDYAYHKGVVLVCAAGNAGQDKYHDINGNSPIIYPGSYEHCIAVGATGFDGTATYYSSHGSFVDIAAPGGDTTVNLNGDDRNDGILQQTFSPWIYDSTGKATYSFNQNFNYYFFSGTSMATPHVAAIAALVFSKHPEYSNDDVRSALIETTKKYAESTYNPTGEFPNNYYGYGLVDALGALNWKHP